MGLITQLRDLIARRKEIPKTENQEAIENYIQSEKQKQRIDYVMAMEKHNFLYGEDKNETS